MEGLSMTEYAVPPLHDDLATRIRLVRRDISNLLFHFTRAQDSETTADIVLRKILREGVLNGFGKWTKGIPCVCFTEAPIQEFASIFALSEIAASKKQRPRYEPYGIAVTKEWLFNQGGRPVIYEHESDMSSFDGSQKQQYRLVPYDPRSGKDFTWEREWRVSTSALKIDPEHAFIIVPTAKEAFDLVYDFSDTEPEPGDGSTGEVVTGFYTPKKRWVAVSLDLFGIHFEATDISSK